jgi:glutathione synthase/RimK-type ligase-like ATP-grasp enzyme
MFDDPRQPDTGFAFMHMHYHPQVRALHKRIMQVMAMNPKLTLVPDYRMSVLYDDKAEQARQLSKWLPRTQLFWTPNGARNFLEKHVRFPFVSKTQEGSSSANVRLVETLDQAKLEVRQAFSDIGIKCKYGQVQRGYLLWQDFIPDNAGDYRIVAIGSKRIMLRRDNRGDRAVSTGPGQITPIRTLTEASLAALEFAHDFFIEEGVKWGCLDVVYDKAKERHFALETTVGWTMHAYTDCAFMRWDPNAGAWMNDGRLGSDVWSVLVEEMEQGKFK